MTTRAPRSVTQLLLDWRNGDPRALDKLMPLVYDELHRLAARYMRRERPDHTLQPTALIHEAYLRLADQRNLQWQNRAQFFAIAAQLMRRIVMKHAHRRHAAKRGGAARKLSIDEAIDLSRERAADLIALDDALTSLATIDPQEGRIVELRFFGGLTVEETAEVLGVSSATVKREWRTAKAWLRKEVASNN
jgi:RNA polymerase sigma factor (TIGR02999 family)